MVLGVVIVDFVLVHIKVHIFPIMLMDCKESIIVDIRGKSDLSIDILQ